MKTYRYRASNVKSTITPLAIVSLRKSISCACQKPSFVEIYSYYHNYVFRWVFLEQGRRTRHG